MRIGIIAALPGELKPLVRGWERQRTGVKGMAVWTIARGGDELIAVCGGVGADAAMRSFSAAEFMGALDLVLSVGWAGALQPEMKTGECYSPSEVIDVQTGERYRIADEASPLRLATVAQVADAQEKLRLHQSYGAALVDMEAATVARLAQMRDIPVRCFKAVSDAPDAVLPDLNPFVDANGQMRMLPFIAYVAVRPRFWGSLIRLGAHSSTAASAIAGQVERFLVERDVQRTGAL
jgi:adenosylhomocysteine nucleosidase